MVDLNPYGRKGCVCFKAESVADGIHYGEWMPNAGCRFHGILADYRRPRTDTGVYSVVPVGYKPPREPEPPQCPPGVHSMFDFCPGGCLSDDEPEYDPRDGCGYLEEGRDCPNDHGPAPKQPCDYDGMYGPHGHADGDVCVVTTTHEETGVRAAAQRWARRIWAAARRR